MVTKNERLEMRLSAEHKELLERAAALSGQALTSFALSHLLEDARSIVERCSKTTLSERDFERFQVILGSDAEPTSALKAAVRRAKARRA